MDGERGGEGRRADGAGAGAGAPTMDVRPVDWLLAGATVGLGLALLAAPFALTSRLSSLYALHGLLEGASTLSRLMMSRWLPPLLAVGPMAVAVYCTVSPLRPARRRGALALALVFTLACVALFVRGLLSPLLAVSAGAS